jgi:hypothetical protein
MFCFHFYERLACGLGEADGGDTATGAGIDGDETTFAGGGLVLFEGFRAVGSAFGTGIIGTSAAGGAAGSDFGFIVLISCFSFAMSFFTPERSPRSPLSDLQPLVVPPQILRSIRRCCSQIRDF